MKKSFNQFDEEKRLPLKFKIYWMTPSCFPVIVIILMSDRGMLLGVPGGLCLGYRGDSVWSTRGSVWGTGGRFLGYTRSLGLDTKCNIPGLTEFFEK